jgi:type II secretory pathway component PulF
LYLCDVPIFQRVTDRLAMFRHRARVMQLLAAGFDQGMPVDEALTQLCGGQTPYPSKLVRRRIAAARRRVLAGREWQDSLEQARLISASDVVALRAAQAAGNLPWALRLLADRKVRLAMFRWTIWQQLLFVALALIFGIIVFWLAAAMLIPLSNLIVMVAE